MMSFDDFKQEIKDNIRDFLPENMSDAKVEIRDILKNNDTKLSGLTISNESNISPTIYLEDFFKEYEDGKDMGAIMTNIAGIYQNAMEMGPQNKEALINSITDFNQAKDMIVARVVNREGNAERLKDMPHKDMGDDLSITYHVNLGDDGNGSQMSVAVNNGILEQYGIDVDRLHEIACENMENLNPTTFKEMREVLCEMMIPEFSNLSQEEKNEKMEEMGLGDGSMPEGGMYVLTNEDKQFGAAALLDTETLDKIREQVGEFYILPSSVHEVLIVPKSEEVELSYLEQMVHEVNSTQVAPNEVLSDHVYAYDSETKEIYRADLEEEHNLSKEAAKEEKSEKKERPSLKEKLEDKKRESKELAKETKDKSIDKYRDNER